MLTEKEACNLHNDIYQALANRGMHECLDLMTVLRKFTEKPKREVQVGDIYKNRNGTPSIIADIDLDDDSPIETTEGVSYHIDGTWGDEEYPELDLDLSKRYELVEVKDVD